jgi:hypothetical protein
MLAAEVPLVIQPIVRPGRYRVPLWLIEFSRPTGSWALTRVKVRPTSLAAPSRLPPNGPAGLCLKPASRGAHAQPIDGKAD